MRRDDGTWFEIDTDDIIGSFKKGFKGNPKTKIGKKRFYYEKGDGKMSDTAKGIMGGTLIVFIGLILLLSSIYTVPAGYRGVMLTFGKPDMTAKKEGIGIKMPIAQKVIKMAVQTQKYEADASSASKDLQVVSTKIAVNYHIIPERVPRIYTDVGLAYQDRLIQPAVQEVVKASTAKFTAEELITRRPEVKEEIKMLMKERLQDRGIIVEDISITNFDFSQSFNSAIEAKVTAEQLKLKAERDLERITVEAQQKIEQAKAEAESLRIQNEQLKESKEVLQLRAIEKWDGTLPKIMGTGTLPFIDITEEIR